jgi:hypothetical protein
MNSTICWPVELTERKNVVTPKDRCESFLDVAKRLEELAENTSHPHGITSVELIQFSKSISIQQFMKERRLAKLRLARNGFIMVTILWVALGLSFYFAGIPYQPVVAVLIATIGIVTVLAMKASGK